MFRACHRVSLLPTTGLCRLEELSKDKVLVRSEWILLGSRAKPYGPRFQWAATDSIVGTLVPYRCRYHNCVHGSLTSFPILPATTRKLDSITSGWSYRMIPPHPPTSSCIQDVMESRAVCRGTPQ